MMRMHKPSSWTTGGLRTRYFPKSRIGQGLIGVGPWVDVVLLIILFVLLDARLVLQPGVIVELPRAPFREGSRRGLVAVVLSVKSAEAGPREEIVFFDDERFLIRHQEQMRALERALAKGARRHPDADLVIQADKRVAHGTVLNIMDVALRVGIEHVNVAARPFE